MTEMEMILALERKFPRESHAVLPGVRNSTGFPRQVRTADALVMSFWKSRGLELWGFEFKQDRGDWLRELKEPAKAEEIAQFCDRWIVLATKETVKKEEVPKAWGWWEIDEKIKIKKEADLLEAKPLTRGFLASIIRSVYKAEAPQVAITEAENKGYGKGFDDGQKEGRKGADNEVIYLRKLKKSVNEFEEASGLQINSWSGGKEIGEQVKLLMRHDFQDFMADKEREIQRFISHAQLLLGAITTFKKS